MINNSLAMELADKKVDWKEKKHVPSMINSKKKCN